MWTFYRQHSVVIGVFAAIWTTFVVMRVAQASFFGPANASLVTPFLSALYIFMPWFVVSLGLGWLLQRWPTLTPARLGLLALVGAGVGVLHVALLASTYWVFWPSLVANVTVGFVFVEQWLAWFHFELVIFAACVLVWRWRTRREPDQAAPMSLLLPSEGGMAQLHPEDIIWLEADDNYVIYHSTEGEHRARSTLSTALAGLPAELFVQTHRSAAVNLAHVRNVSTNRVELTSLKRAPISRRRQREVRNRLQAVSGK